mmetsp:Transcript_7070/g.21072  ORF Transcript_7070/g.21072 Transcript_7070/m.21072 type:complete len:201 (+) Transcript_7070:985-1587(+)
MSHNAEARTLNTCVVWTPSTAISPKAQPASRSPTTMPPFSTTAWPCAIAYISLHSVPSLMIFWPTKKNLRCNVPDNLFKNSRSLFANKTCRMNKFDSSVMGFFSNLAAPTSWKWTISRGNSARYFMKIGRRNTCTKHTVTARKVAVRTSDKPSTATSPRTEPWPISDTCTPFMKQRRVPSMTMNIASPVSPSVHRFSSGR